MKIRQLRSELDEASNISVIMLEKKRPLQSENKQVADISVILLKKRENQEKFTV